MCVHWLYYGCQMDACAFFRAIKSAQFRCRVPMLQRRVLSRGCVNILDQHLHLHFLCEFPFMACLSFTMRNKQVAM